MALTWNAFDRAHKIYVWMAAVFVVSLVIANLIGAMLFSFRLSFLPEPVLLSAGIIPFPITFILTDLLNEFYGKQGARFVTWVGFGMCLLTFAFLSVGEHLPLDARTLISKPVFMTISTQYTGMFIASLTAYLIGQMLDIQVFHLFRSITKHRFIWLRATGSTVISQLFDSIIVTLIAFWGQMPVGDMLQLATGNYTWKFIIAVSITPLLYLGHLVLRKLMPKQEALVEALVPEYRPE
jgi:queuosine precursor transporter